MLIAPITTIYYDTGFLIGLKGFVAAIIGGLASYPLAAAGAILVGLLESFGSFWASAFKEVIVFTLIIPVLLWRSLPPITWRKKNEAAPVAHPGRLPRRLLRWPGADCCPSSGHAAQLHRPVRAGRAGPGAADRHGRPDLLRPGRLRRPRRLHHGLPDHPHGAVSPWLTLIVGLAVTAAVSLLLGS
jgi:ABC-type branched-subunit amino acid transport system permease subunit